MNQGLDATHFYSDSSAKLSTPSSSNFKVSTDINSINPDYDLTININFPLQEEFVGPIYRRPSSKDLELPAFLADKIDDGKLVNKFLPKQSYID